MKREFESVCRPGSGWAAFFAGIFVWGIGIGSFQAVFNNFLVETYNIGGRERGMLELFREMPGVCLILILALLHKHSDKKVLRIGTVFSAVAAALLLFPVPWAGAVLFITVWALGEHLVMPVRQSIALSIAKEGKSGESLGIVTGAVNWGTVLGSLLAAAVFFAGDRIFAGIPRPMLYRIVWAAVIVLLCLSLHFGKGTADGGAPQRARPSFYFRRKYSKFYALELFYGARKQVFFTFGPLVLIKIYGMDTKTVSLLFGVSAFLTALWGGRLIGKLTDAWGYRNVMIWDTVALFFVCLAYGYADKLFGMKLATIVVCANYILDAMLSNASIATNLYARTLSENQEELTATLSSGISVNHIVTIFYALFSGWVFDKYGAGVLFSFAAATALANSLVALTVPKCGKRA